MAFFSGYNPVCLDAQKRLAIPARYREALMGDAGGVLVVTLGLDITRPFLELYPMPEWNIRMEKIRKLPSLHPVSQLLKRRVVGHASELSIDKNARILIPQALRELAKIERDVVLSGVGEKFELWEESAWNEVRDSEFEKVDFASLPADLQDF